LTPYVIERLRLSSTLLFAQCFFFEDFGFVGLFPGEVKVIPPEVPVTSRSSKDRSAQIKVPKNGSRSEVKVLVNQGK